ncbi:uncharacterized protein PHALS_06183 [Plasmopara halstedii]|uniref:Uncharacterized protein n=1 Tax=Plasmopara halstedii TaxID=4781 RepID=A0A0P1B284_PLAHL|nr:uncharacterized protein PHALS_06183 [Plasmopara halstedii]CEG48357.1 hypothetical protein PHALS_06183 [Plasmopara halstedii]|eukprot:XP_024584726.1 hypothetical protein PHALS_06183 [Plasmopara halstedii]
MAITSRIAESDAERERVQRFERETRKRLFHLIDFAPTVSPTVVYHKDKVITVVLGIPEQIS